MKGIVSIHGREYKTVALRVSEFREKYPIDQGWSIETSIESIDEVGVVIKAKILDASNRVVATGHGHERWNSSQINETSCVENCETSAIGRALASAGFGGSEFASANEVENAVHQQLHRKARKAVAVEQPPTHSADWEKFAEWITKTYSEAIANGEPYSSFDDIDRVIASSLEVLEPAKLTTTGDDGEILCDWDRLRACDDPSVFRALCKIIQKDYRERMEATFA